MAKTAGAGRAKPAYRCAECGWQSAKWVGRCGECQAWGTVGEAGAPTAPPRVVAAGPVTTPARPIGAVDVQSARCRPTGLDELDRVLGGGLVPGAVVLLAGEPGIGKSTLLLEVAALCADRAAALYVTGEESAEQVRLRADRVGAVTDRLYLAAETDLAALLGQVDAVRPEMLVVDSIQTIGTVEADGAPGGVTQIREVTANLIRVAKERGITVVLVGHVTKDGAIAGPRLLEHLVDVVLYFEGDRHSRLRMIRAVKNRYGPTDELGCFDLSEMGIVGLPDPSGLFLTRRDEPVPGTCVTVTLEGRRPLVAEVQALVAESFLPSPRRATSGLESARVAMVLAVLGRRCHIAMHQQDVYASTVGGVRLTETSVDLAVALAVAGSKVEQALSPNVIALGEVGLAGEVRAVPGVRRRLGEAGRLGFSCAVVPRGSLELGEATPLKRSGRPAQSARPGRTGDAGRPRRPERPAGADVATALSDVNITSGNGRTGGFEGMTIYEVDSLNQALQVAFTAT
ncbi:MAG TPA: DNA repair protein RadA [Streptosporangiaceae bacterium]|nr:DNA repair protein RadA [Streptosporangiaceae bacterium]